MKNERYSELEQVEQKARKPLASLLKVIRKKSNFLDGNLFYVDLEDAEKIEPNLELREKRQNLVKLAKNKKNILEIGFNAGHSALIILLMDSHSKITIIDTCQHNYTESCFNELNKLFPNRMKLIKGDSTQVIKQLEGSKFDLIHYDGGKEKTIWEDLHNTKELVEEDHVLLIDDTQNKELKQIILTLEKEKYIELTNYKIMTERTEKFKWTHAIATFVNTKNIEQTNEVLTQLKTFYDHEEFPSIYTNVSNVENITGYKRAQSLVQIIHNCKYLEGDFVECGVAAGHSSIIAALSFLKFEIEKKKLYLYDTFDGFNFPLTEEKDIHGKSIKEYDLSKYSSSHTSLEIVYNKMLKTGIDNNRIKMIKGMVEETIPNTMPEKINILRLDVDLYDSTRHCLNEMFPLLVDGGYLIIDDYGHWEGCQKAVDEYFKENNLDLDSLIYIDYTCRVYKKNSIKSMDSQDENLKGLEGGAWDEKTHDTLYPGNFNKGLSKYIVKNICPTNFLEFGSGLGLLANYIYKNSKIEKAYCIEPNKIDSIYNDLDSPTLIPLDIFSEKHPSVLNERFDLVLSIEVAEHIEIDKHEYLFDFLISHTKRWLIFSGGHIGQGGHGHISERSEEDWKSEFFKRGMLFEEELTNNIRAASDDKNINHKMNLLVFRRENNFIETNSVEEEINNFKNNYKEINYLPIYTEAVKLQRDVLNKNIEEMDKKNSFIDNQVAKLKRKDELIQQQKIEINKINELIQKQNSVIERKEERNKLNIKELNRIKMNFIYKFFHKIKGI